MLTKNESRNEIVKLDASFILKFLGKISKAPVEIKLLENYSLRVTNEDNTILAYRNYLKKRFKVENDNDLFGIINKRLYTKNTLKIKAIMDSLVSLNFGNEVVDAKFKSFIVANNNEVIVEMEIKRWLLI